MKKNKSFYIKIIVAIVALCIMLYLSINVIFVFKTNISNDKVATVKYICDDKNISVTLTEDESQTLADILKDKELIFDFGVSCGFSGNYSIKFDQGFFANEFYPSCDGCGTIQYKGRVFYLTNEELNKLKDIFEKYGIPMPAYNLL